MRLTRGLEEPEGTAPEAGVVPPRIRLTSGSSATGTEPPGSPGEICRPSARAPRSGVTLAHCTQRSKRHWPQEKARPPAAISSSQSSQRIPVELTGRHSMLCLAGQTPRRLNSSSAYVPGAADSGGSRSMRNSAPGVRSAPCRRAWHAPQRSVSSSVVHWYLSPSIAPSQPLQMTPSCRLRRWRWTELGRLAMDARCGMRVIGRPGLAIDGRSGIRFMAATLRHA
mmetsp:Transcript_86578/g.268034  ORF Transcript_86578/g.268034 Transcript_86578/m.268034 type:complete len:225 (+) Transcript_86578:478-1152(+)